jgi:CHASE2 domain-containing sensor protein
MNLHDKRIVMTFCALFAGVVLGIAAWWLPIVFSMMSKTASAAAAFLGLSI